MKQPQLENVFDNSMLEYRTVEKNRLILSLAITAIVMVVEFIGGILTNSIALISDAGHMFTHSFAISISLGAILLSRTQPCHHRTFGLYRAEILAAFVNGLFLLLVVVIVVYESILRIINPIDILAVEMLLIALLGLIVNVTSILILQSSNRNDLNIRGLFFHMIADVSSSVAIIITAFLIFWTGWSFLDPIVSLFISLIILHWAWGILKESTRVLLEMSPHGLNTEDLLNDLKRQFPLIEEINNAHLWSITPEMLVFTAHLKVNSQSSLSDAGLLTEISNYLCNNYSIVETTIQII